MEVRDLTTYRRLEAYINIEPHRTMLSQPRDLVKNSSFSLAIGHPRLDSPKS